MTADEVPPDKVCTKCGTGDAGFYKDKRSRDGFQSYCKHCSIETAMKSWKRNKALDPLYDRKRFEATSASKRFASKARRRGLFYDLKHEQVDELVSGPCYYCGYEPKEASVISNRGAVTYLNGLDRIDSDVGYTSHNVVVCCKYCNDAKNSKTLGQFRDHITRLYQNMSAKNWEVIPAFTNQTPQPVETTTTSTSTSPFSFEWFNDAAD
jgi:hypothetical protein